VEGSNTVLVIGAKPTGSRVTYNGSTLVLDGMSFRRTRANGLRFYGQEGADVIRAQGLRMVELYTAGGNDQVLVSGSTVFVDAGAGNDIVQALGGRNIVIGNTGADRIYASGRSLVVTGTADLDTDVRAAIFAELGMRTPRASVLSAMLGDDTGDDGEIDDLFVMSRNVYGRLGPSDRVRLGTRLLH
jgi:hypothetical protein